MKTDYIDVKEHYYMTSKERLSAEMFAMDIYKLSHQDCLEMSDKELDEFIDFSQENS